MMRKYQSYRQSSVEAGRKQLTLSTSPEKLHREGAHVLYIEV